MFVWDKFKGFKKPFLCVNVMWIRLLLHGSHNSKTTQAVIYDTQEVLAIFCYKLHTLLVSGWGNANTGELCSGYMSNLIRMKKLVCAKIQRRLFWVFFGCCCRSHKPSRGCKKKGKKRHNAFFWSACSGPEEGMTCQHQCYGLTFSGREATLVKNGEAIR